MKLTITSLGAIDYANIELGNITLICGENNTGKTYVTYGMYGFLNFWHEGYRFPIPAELPQTLQESGSVNLDLEPYFNTPNTILKDACADYKDYLPTVFAAPKSRYVKTEFEVEAQPVQTMYRDEIERSFNIGTSEFVVAKRRNSYILELSRISGMGQARKFPPIAIARLAGQIAKDLIFGVTIPRPFIISAERTGAAMFKNELNLKRNRLIEEIGKSDKDIDPFEFLTKSYSDYPLPVKANIDFARRRETIHTQESFIAKSHKEILIEYEGLIGGTFHVDREQILRFIPKGTQTRLSMDESSSSVRSLLDLGLYLACVAAPGDLLIIDEPELNLHPQNQRKVARLISRLVGIGLRVLVTTHSDYFVKELNLLILMKSNDERIRTIADREKYHRDEAISPEQIKVYVASTESIQKPGKTRRSSCRTLKCVPVDADRGIEIASFDRSIEDLNRIEDELLYGA